MSSAKRRINFTGRKRISRDHIDIRLLEAGPDDTLKATLRLDLGGLGFPANAALAVEAYHRSTGMRFDCGTISDPSVPECLELSEIDPGVNVLFRVRVIDQERESGMLLGSAEGIQPRSDEDGDGRRSIFPVLQLDLRQEVWKVDVDEQAGPSLILNNRIPGFKMRLLENPLLQGAILPNALRIVLQKIAEDPIPDDDYGWKTDWLLYCQEGLGVSDDPSELGPDERTEWVEDVLRSFCEKAGFVGNITQYIREGIQDAG